MFEANEITRVPRHVAIIPDGNRRFAKEKGKSVYEGHRAGASMFKEVAEQAAKRNIKYLSAWGMSLDNYTKRSIKEVAGLMRIFKREFERLEKDEGIHKRQTRVQVFGRWREKFPATVKKAIEKAIDATAGYDRYYLNFFLAYSGTDEMLTAMRQIVNKARVGKVKRITAKTIKQHLSTRDLPPVDLVIRTAGEPHLSAGFMMWDVADAQLYFTDKYWPDFTLAEFDKALTEYSKRERRLGA